MERVRSLVRSERRLTLRMISSELNLKWFTVNKILTHDLDMRKVCAKMVPKNLTTEQKANGRDFWQRKAFLWFLSPPIRRISVLVTSFYSPGSKTT